MLASSGGRQAQESTSKSTCSLARRHRHPFWLSQPLLAAGTANLDATPDATKFTKITKITKITKKNLVVVAGAANQRTVPSVS